MNADAIIEFMPSQSVLSKKEKHRLTCMVETLARQSGLGVALSALWEQQKAIGFILGNPSVGENLDDESVFLSKRTGPYWLIHSAARKDRGHVHFLKGRGILAQRSRLVYEKLKGGVYDHYPAKKQGFEDICFLCSAEEANPNEVLVSVDLCGAEFVYGANFATLGHGHFTVWTRVPILQEYWPEDTLLWLQEHGKRLKSDQYTTFFNGSGAGNSIKHFHYQTLREVFPISRAAVRKRYPHSVISRLEWPLPAYRVTMTAKRAQVDGLSQMDRLILAWLAIESADSLNLVHTCDSYGNSQVVFVPRVDSPETRRPPAIGNDFAGCEVGGRIHIESLDEWKWASKQQEHTIANLLSSLAPPDARIAELEATL